MNVLGLDIGGANLKAAHTNGCAVNVPFALWKNPDGLASALRNVLAAMPSAEALAVTMTGELCDCFESKRQGVGFILNAVASVAEKMPLHVWQNDGHFVDVTAARQSLLPIASANWLALATFAGRYAPEGPALLFDIGSTTTDIVPLLNGVPVPKKRTDPERLKSSELLYLGVRRTPLCALAGIGCASELFATTLDLNLILGHLPEDAEDRNTADGRPATKEFAEARIARMLCADLETSTEPERRHLIDHLLNEVTMVLGFALHRVAARLPAPPQTVVYSGEGEFLIRLALKKQTTIPPCRVVSLSRELGAEVSRAACAYAVAVLAAESSSRS